MVFSLYSHEQKWALLAFHDCFRPLRCESAYRPLP